MKTSRRSANPLGYHTATCGKIWLVLYSIGNGSLPTDSAKLIISRSGIAGIYDLRVEAPTRRRASAGYRSVVQGLNSPSHQAIRRECGTARSTVPAAANAPASRASVRWRA